MAADRDRRLVAAGARPGVSWITHAYHSAYLVAGTEAALPVDTGQRAEQLPELEVAEFTAAFAENALYWTRFTDLEPHFRRLDELLGGEHPIDARGQEGPRLAAASGTQGS